MSDLCVSVDVETTGRIPGTGESALIQLGACVACVLNPDGSMPARPSNDSRKHYGFKVNIFEPLDTPGDPETVRWLESEGIPDRIQKEGSEYPDKAMLMFREWVYKMSAHYQGAKPVFVGYPAGFDWTFTHWYFEHFMGIKSDPFGFGEMLDIKSMYAAKACVPCSKSTKRHMPKSLTDVGVRHTHDALDDAIGQAELFCNVWEWDPTKKEEE